MLSNRSFHVLTLLTAILASVLCSACRSPNEAEEGVAPMGKGEEGITVVNAPVAGVVRRLLVGEGAAVSKDAELIEIAVPVASSTLPADDPRARARAAAQNAQREVTFAQSEAERAAVEVQRLEPLVKEGIVAQAQLDAARAQYQRAQERLQLARDRGKSAQTDLVIQEGKAMPAATIAPTEQVVIVRVPANGTVRVISVRAGQQVTVGQPLATVLVSKG